MGIDYDGGMIVGEQVDQLCIPDTDELADYEWVEENDLDRMSLWYDCPFEECIIGYCVEDIPVSEINGEWLDNVNKLSKKFEKFFGVPARLIGTQDIW